MDKTWQNTKGGLCPCARNLWVDVMRADGTVDYGMPARGWNWGDGPFSPIRAWRVSDYGAADFARGQGALSVVTTVESV